MTTFLLQTQYKTKLDHVLKVRRKIKGGYNLTYLLYFPKIWTPLSCLSL